MGLLVKVLEQSHYHFTGVWTPLLGRIRTTVLRREAAPVLRSGDATSARLDAASRRWRRLSQLDKLWPQGSGPLPPRAGQVLEALCKAEPFTSPWLPRLRAAGG